MKFPLFPASAALGLALLVSGCESDGSVSARAQEKSATYAALKPWQKKYVDTGSITEGFTPDMVYISMGKPDKVEPKELPAGPSEVWTYNRFYQHADAAHGFEHANFHTDTDYKAEGATRSGRGAISNNNGVQGGSMEPADLRSYTVRVTFTNGIVVKIRPTPNL